MLSNSRTLEGNTQASQEKKSKFPYMSDRKTTDRCDSFQSRHWVFSLAPLAKADNAVKSSSASVNCSTYSSSAKSCPDTILVLPGA